MTTLQAELTQQLVGDKQLTETELRHVQDWGAWLGTAYLSCLHDGLTPSQADIAVLCLFDLSKLFNNESE